MPHQHRFSPEYITTAAHLLGILSHETRLNIVLFLAPGPATVTGICEHLELTQSNTSHHLRILRDTGLVTDERDGKFVIYQINIPVWRRIGDGFFDHLLEGHDEVTLQYFRIERIARAAADPAPSR